MSLGPSIGLVSQLAVFFHKRRDQIEKAGKPEIYLDGPFLMDVLGFCGDERRNDASIIISMARRKGCKIGVFEHSISEARDIVYAVINNHPIHRHGPTAAAIRSGEISTPMLEVFVNNRYEFVQNSGFVDFIQNHKDKKISVNEEYFTEDDEQAFWGRLSSWHNDVARTRDATSVRCIMRIRKGRADRNPWKSGAFLLSSNKLLQRLSQEFCVHADMISKLEVGPVVSRQEFAAMLWLAGDQENKAEISSSRLMAAAQGILARDRGLVEKLVDYHSGISGERKELVEAIVKSELSYELLQDATSINPSRPIEDAIDDVVSELVDHGKRAGRAEVRQTRAVKLNKTQNELQTLSKQYSEVSEQYRKAELKLERHTTAVEIIKNIIDRAEINWSRDFECLQKIVSKILTIAFVVLAAVATIILSYFQETIPFFAALPVACIAVAISEFAAFVKSRKIQLAFSISKLLFQQIVENSRMELDDQLGDGSPPVALEYVKKRVLITNKSDILCQID